MVRVPMGRSLPACLLVLLMLGFGCSALEHVKFSELDPAAPNQVVLMMEHADDSGEEILNAVLETEEFIHDIGGGNITFKMCDASNPVNAKAMAEKGLQDFPLLFVSIAGQGMDRYVREITTEKLSEYLVTMLEPTSDEDVFPYNEEYITPKYPVLVKFYEKWCSRCLAMQKAFENAATRMAGRVIFMEVECSASSITQQFCTKHKVDGFPTLKLMGGGLPNAILFERDRSVQGMVEFLNEHVPEEDSEDDGAGEAPADATEVPAAGGKAEL